MRCPWLLALLGALVIPGSALQAADTDPCAAWNLEGYVLGMTRDEAQALRPATLLESGALKVTPIPGRSRAGWVLFTDEGKVSSVSLLSTAGTKEEIEVLFDGLRARLGEPSVVDQKTWAFDRPMRQTAWVNQGCDAVVYVNVERSLTGAMFGRMVEVGLVPAVGSGSPVTEESGRVVFPGYSVEPPRGEGWRRAPEGTEGGNVVFGKPTTTRFHTIAAMAEGVFAPLLEGDPAKVAAGETLNVLAGGALERVGKPGPTSPTSRIESADLGGASCLRYDHMVPDAPADTPNAPALELAIHGVVCRHPDFPRFYVSASWSERRPKSVAAAGVDEVGRAFLDGLVLEPIGFDVTTIDLHGSAWGIASADGSVWVAHHKGRLARIDPATGAVREDLKVGDTPVGVAATEDAVWVAAREDDEVVRIDPKTNRVVARVKTGKQPLYIAAGVGSVWAGTIEGNSVTRIDAATNKVLARIEVGKDPAAIAVCPQGVFVTNSGSGTVSRIDPQTNKAVAEIGVGKVPYLLTCDAGSVWVTLEGESVVVRIDAESGKVTGRFAVGRSPGGVVAYRGAIWVAGTDDASVTALDPSTGEPLASPLPGGVGPIAIAVVGDDLWVTDAGGNAVHRFRPK